MSKKSKLFTEELARRNPDWKKIIAVHNDALAAERKKAQPVVEALTQITKGLWAGEGESHPLIHGWEVKQARDALKKYQQVTS